MTTCDQLEKEMKGANAFIYGENFPSILSERMIRQTTHIVDDRDSKDELILRFHPWFITEEGEHFWSDIRKLYSLYKEPKLSQIKMVFAFYNISYEL